MKSSRLRSFRIKIYVLLLLLSDFIVLHMYIDETKNYNSFFSFIIICYFINFNSIKFPRKVLIIKIRGIFI